MHKIGLKYLVIIALVLFLSDCSTEKNTGLTRSYHNLTAHYNIFFNGEESFKKGLKKMELSFTDNYAKILPMFKYSDEEVASNIAPDMDRAVKKSSKLISMHSITAKPKRKKGALSKREKEFYSKNEFNKWVDDAYLLIGKANFYKRDFSTAEQTLKFVISNYPKTKEFYIAQLYLLRTFIESKEFKKAGELFDKISSDKKLPAKMMGEFNAIYSDYYLKQKQFELAIPKLIKTIEKTRKKKLKTRYTFILAQVYHIQKNNDKAIECYEKVLKLNPTYDMTFNAKIKRATLLDAGSGESNEIKKELKKMLKDDKNKEYLDQIYYALGKIALNEGDKEKAIDYFKKSSNASIFNTTQKVMSFLQLAELYFEMPKYQLAKAYYDSTVAFITTDYPNYDEIIVNTKILNELVTNLNIIEYQDSLQKVAAMSESEREKLIDKLIEKAEEEEKLKQEMLEMQRLNKMYNTNADNSYRTNISSTGKWYFYNPSAMSFGQTEFQRIWGNRKLEDNWRRSNKQSIDQFTKTDEVEDSTIVVSEKDKYKKTDRNYYLADLPFTEEKMANSNKLIAEAYFNAGKIYREKLEDNELAKSSFENMIKRYPEDENALQAYYYLYLISKALGDISSADYYKNIILRKYPTSNYVQILTNPNYVKEVEARLDKIEQFYYETYNYYINGQFDLVRSNYAFAQANYSDSYLMPKFMMLKSLTEGENNNRRKLKSALQEVIKSYPENEVAVIAKDIITAIEEMEFKTEEITEKTDITKEETDKIAKQNELLYTLNKDTAHVVVLIAKTSIDINQFKFNITSYIVDYYDFDKQIISDEPFSESFRIIKVTGFENADTSMVFYRGILNDKNTLAGFDPKDYQLFVISVTNYNVFMKDKSVIDYKRFFIENYLKK